MRGVGKQRVACAGALAVRAAAAHLWVAAEAHRDGDDPASQLDALLRAHLRSSRRHSLLPHARPILGAGEEPSVTSRLCDQRTSSVVSRLSLHAPRACFSLHLASQWPTSRLSTLHSLPSHLSVHTLSVHTPSHFTPSLPSRSLSVHASSLDIPFRSHSLTSSTLSRLRLHTLSGHIPSAHTRLP